MKLVVCFSVSFVHFCFVCQTAPVSCLHGANDSNSVQNHSDFLSARLMRLAADLNSLIVSFFGFHIQLQGQNATDDVCVRKMITATYIYCIYIVLISFPSFVTKDVHRRFLLMLLMMLLTLCARISNLETFHFVHFVCTPPRKPSNL